MNRRLLQWLPWVMALAPAWLALGQILHFGVDVPYWDQFDDDLAGLHVKVHEGGLTWRDLAAQHNEHRILLPRIASLGLGWLTSGNAVAEMVAGWAVVVATSLALAALAARTAPAVDAAPGRWRASLSWFLVNVLLFTPAQYENWLWGMGLANFQPALWTVLALLAATGRGSEVRRLALVIAACGAAAWSSGNGMLAWPLAGAVVLARSRAEENGRAGARWRSAAVLAAAAAVGVAVYVHGLAPPNHRGVDPYVSTLAAKAHYFLVFAGSPWAEVTGNPSARGAAVAGALLLAVLAACLARVIVLGRARNESDRRERVWPWLAVAGFACGSGVLAAWARAGIGAEQATSSRYVSFAIYLPVALVYLVPALEPWRLFLPRRFEPAKRAVRWGLGLAASGLVVAAVAVVPPAWEASAETRARRWQVRGVMVLTELLPRHPAVTALVFPDAKVAQRNVAGLARIGYLRPRPFTSARVQDHLAPAAPPAERVGQLERVWQSGPGVVALAGWAVLPDRGRVADLVVVCAANAAGEQEIVDFAATGAARPDKAGADPMAAQAGWARQVPIEALIGGGRPGVVTAWALDAERGVLLPLEGTVTLGR